MMVGYEGNVAVMEPDMVIHPFYVEMQIQSPMSKHVYQIDEFHEGEVLEISKFYM